MRLASAKAGVRTFDTEDGGALLINISFDFVRDGRPHCKVGGQSSSENASISALLGKASRGDGSQPIVFLDAIKAYLREKDGGNMADCNTLDFENFAISTATLYARMLSDNLLSILKEIASNKDIYTHGFATKCSVLVDGSPIVSD